MPDPRLEGKERKGFCPQNGCFRDVDADFACLEQQPADGQELHPLPHVVLPLRFALIWQKITAATTAARTRAMTIVPAFSANQFILRTPSPSAL